MEKAKVSSGKGFKGLFYNIHTEWGKIFDKVNECSLTIHNVDLLMVRQYENYSIEYVVHIFIYKIMYIINFII